jgi:spore maturation protein CgeB
MHYTVPNPAPDAVSLTDRRVLLVGASRAPDSMENHVLDALRALGATAEYATTTIRFEVFGTAANALIDKVAHSTLREPERLLERRLVNRAERFAPDLVLVLQGNHISPKTVAQLRRRTEARIVCWCQDHLGVLGRQYLLGAEYDAVFVKDRYMLELFSSMVKGTPFFYLPEACNPRVHRPLELTPEDRRRYACDVMIYGSLYYYRQAILQQLGEFDLKIWGHAARWFVNRLERTIAGPNVVLDEKVRAVRAARIALNPLHYGEINALNCRTFELAGCGAFQLVAHKPVLKEHFAPGSEIDEFRTTDELIEKMRHYLQRPELAAAIAKRGQERAHRDHTYEHRLRKIIGVALEPRA